MGVMLYIFCYLLISVSFVYISCISEFTFLMPLCYSISGLPKFIKPVPYCWIFRLFIVFGCYSQPLSAWIWLEGMSVGRVPHRIAEPKGICICNFDSCCQIAFQKFALL